MIQLFQRLIRWFSTPQSSPTIHKRNFVNVQIDAIGVGLANAAAPFLPVFLAREGASNLEVSLLTTMPAVTGLLLSIPIGRLLQRQRDIVPWFSGSRLLYLTSYALTGLAIWLVPKDSLIFTILLIWALVTIPQTALSISFSVVMNAVAGPVGRFELMSRRWSILGLTTSITVMAVGWTLDRLAYPLNYQMVFLGLSVGGLISYYFSSHLTLQKVTPPAEVPSRSIRESVSNYLSLISSQKAFVSFVAKRLVYNTGAILSVPLLPLYFVREVKASDSWIATITTAQTAILILGYFFWTRQSRSKGARKVLLWTTFGLSLYPLAVALTHQVGLIAIFAGVAGIFQAGLNLVFFDELMKTVPPEYSATFISFSQSLEYIPSILAPLLASFLASWIGLGAGLLISAAFRLIGFLLFFFEKQTPSAARA